MEAICSSETSVATQQTTRRHIPEDDTLYTDLCYGEQQVAWWISRPVHLYLEGTHVTTILSAILTGFS
jgi:hypothetical protein